MTSFIRNILRVAVLILGLLATHLPVYVAHAADNSQTVDDEALGQQSGSIVEIDALANDLPEGPWEPSTVRIVDPSDFVTLVTKYVEPDQGIWEVDTANGNISFTPCTGAGVPDPACTQALDTYMPYPISYQVEDTVGTLSNEAQIYISYSPPLGISLAYFSSNRTSDMTDFVWVMAFESGISGYNILVEGDEGLEPINDQLIESEVIDSQTPQLYEYTVQTDQEIFYLQEVSINGGVAVDGPFTLGRSYGENPFETNREDTSIFLPFISRL